MLDTEQRNELKEKRAEELAENFKLYTLTEIEPIIGVHHRTLLMYIKAGKLKAVKLGGRWKVSAENLRAFINGEQ